MWTALTLLCPDHSLRKIKLTTLVVGICKTREHVLIHVHQCMFSRFAYVHNESCQFNFLREWSRHRSVTAVHICTRGHKLPAWGGPFGIRPSRGRSLNRAAFSAVSQTGRKISANRRITRGASRYLSGDIVSDKSNSWVDDCGVEPL